jgi:hypothetical protein
MPKVYKSQLIEVVQTANSTATKLQFNDFPYLRGRKIYGIEMFTGADMTTSPTGKTLPTVAQAQVTYLTLYLDDQSTGVKNVGEWIQNVPFASLHRVQNSATNPFVRQMFEMTGQIVYWEKCFFNFGTWTAVGSDVSFCLTVYFQ